MTIKTAVRGTLGLGAACLLAGGVALAQGSPATSAQGDPTVPTTTDPQASSDTTNDDTATSQPATSQDDTPVSVAGRIDKVDRADDTIEIDGVDRQLKLDPSTRVTRNGAQASFSDVQEGEQVRASFDDGFPAHVRQIEIMNPSGSTASGSSSDTSSDMGPASSPAPTGTGVAPSTGSGSTEPDSAPVGHPLPATPSGSRSGSP